MKIRIINKSSDINIIRRIIKENDIRLLIKNILKDEDKRLGEINIILQSDKEELEINKKFLKHNYYTDVIAFQYNKKDIIKGDIFISIENVRKNAISYNEDIKIELLRVIIHGVLHLIGYSDKNDREKKIMRKRENKYLMLINLNNE